MLTRESALKQAKLFAQACSTLPVKINQFILFGSAANNTANDQSDIDIALISENFSENILSNIDLIGKVAIKFPNIDIHTFSNKEFSGNSLLIDEIKKTGIVIQKI